MQCKLHWGFLCILILLVLLRIYKVLCTIFTIKWLRHADCSSIMQSFSNPLSRGPLLQYKTCRPAHTTVTMQKNMYPYHWILQIRVLMPTFRILVFRDVSMSPATQQRCGNLKYRSCYFSNLTRLDDREESVFIFEQWNNILIYSL
jgi:hypothetical protein